MAKKEHIYNLKEIYGKTYPKDTSVKPLGTEYSIEKGDTKEITSIRADITVLIGKTDIYHFDYVSIFCRLISAGQWNASGYAPL